VRQLAVLTVSLYLAAGAVGWTCFAAWTFVCRELSPTADRTSKFVYYGGQAVLWGFGVLVAGLVLGGAATAVWRALAP
jgi:hypothetical protein